MRQAIRTRLDGLPRALQRTDVNDREFFAVVRGGYHCAHRFRAQSGHRQAKRFAIVINDFDVVRTFGNPGIDKGLGIARVR